MYQIPICEWPTSTPIHNMASYGLPHQPHDLKELAPAHFLNPPFTLSKDPQALSHNCHGDLHPYSCPQLSLCLPPSPSNVTGVRWGSGGQYSGPVSVSVSASPSLLG